MPSIKPSRQSGVCLKIPLKYTPKKQAWEMCLVNAFRKYLQESPKKSAQAMDLKTYLKYSQ